ncbi:MAG: hypothetical protein AAF394_09415 [Planctomycetota bacterium]
MSRRMDEGKLRSWRERLAKFESDGLSVAEFCRRQRIGPTQFYYWLRRVREAEVASDSQKANDGSRKGSARTSRATSGSHPVPARMEVYLGDSVRVSLPTDDPALVASVVHELRASSQPANAFELVDVVAER